MDKYQVRFYTRDRGVNALPLGEHVIEAADPKSAIDAGRELDVRYTYLVAFAQKIKESA